MEFKREIRADAISDEAFCRLALLLEHAGYDITPDASQLLEPSNPQLTAKLSKRDSFANDPLLCAKSIDVKREPDAVSLLATFPLLPPGAMQGPKRLAMFGAVSVIGVLVSRLAFGKREDWWAVLFGALTGVLVLCILFLFANWCLWQHTKKHSMDGLASLVEAAIKSAQP
jgi:hypothetical protein